MVVSAIKQVGRNNTALVVYLTKELKALGVREGQYIKITIEPIEDA